MAADLLILTTLDLTKDIEEFSEQVQDRLKITCRIG